jgi:hypothetical protein
MSADRPAGMKNWYVEQSQTEAVGSSNEERARRDARGRVMATLVTALEDGNIDSFNTAWNEMYLRSGLHSGSAKYSEFYRSAEGLPYVVSFANCNTECRACYSGWGG